MDEISFSDEGEQRWEIDDIDPRLGAGNSNSRKKKVRFDMRTSPERKVTPRLSTDFSGLRRPRQARQNTLMHFQARVLNPLDLKDDLLRIFTYYGIHKVGIEASHLTHRQFVKFARECNIRQSSAHIRLEIAQTCAKVKTHKITWECFVELLLALAKKKYPRENPQQAMKMFLMNHALPTISRNVRDPVTKAISMHQAELEAITSAFRPVLQVFQKRYSQRTEIERNGKKKIYYVTGLNLFLQFVRDFSLAKQYVSIKDLTEVFVGALSSFERTAYHHSCIYSGFENALVRLALMNACHSSGNTVNQLNPSQAFLEFMRLLVYSVRSKDKHEKEGDRLVKNQWVPFASALTRLESIWKKRFERKVLSEYLEKKPPKTGAEILKALTKC